MENIDPSKLVKMLNQGFDGKVVLSGKVKVIINGTPLSENAGEFTLSQSQLGKEYFSLASNRKEPDGSRSYYSNFKLRKGKLPQVDGDGHIAIPIDYKSPQEDNTGIWMIVQPKKITY